MQLAESITSPTRRGRLQIESPCASNHRREPEERRCRIELITGSSCSRTRFNALTSNKKKQNNVRDEKN